MSLPLCLWVVLWLFFSYYNIVEFRLYLASTIHISPWRNTVRGRAKDLICWQEDKSEEN